MVKIYTKGNYFFLVKDNIEYEGHRKEVLIKRLTTTSTDFFFKQVNNWNDSEVVSLSDMVDENDVAYTLQTFLDFRKDETGNFNNGGGNGMGLQGSNTLYFDDATYVYISGLRANGDWYVNRNTIADNTQTTATETNNGGQTTQPLTLVICQGLIYS